MACIVCVISRMDTGGAEKVLHDVAIGLNQGSSEHRVTVVSLYGKGRLGYSLVSRGVEVYEKVMNNKLDIQGIFKFIRILKGKRPDILYVMAQPLTQAVCSIASIFVNIPVKVVAFHSHNLDKRPFHKLLIDKLSLFSAARVICVSESQREHIVINKKVPFKKIKVIYNGIDTNIFKPHTKKAVGDRHACPLPDDSVIIGSVGSVRKEKGFDILIKAMPEILKNYPKAFFVIVGNGPERLALERSALDLKVYPKVRFLGERQDVPSIIPFFDIACSSSRTENFPLSILEYMACGKPVVATNVGGVSEMISNGFNGILVDPESPEELARGIVYLLKNRGLGESMGMNARRFVAKNFTAETMVENYKIFFNEVYYLNR